MEILVREPALQRHTAALAAAPELQATIVRLLLRHVLPQLVNEGSAARLIQPGDRACNE
jgi:hypothetical protein